VLLGLKCDEAAGFLLPFLPLQQLGPRLAGYPTILVGFLEPQLWQEPQFSAHIQHSPVLVSTKGPYTPEREALAAWDGLDGLDGLDGWMVGECPPLRRRFPWPRLSPVPGTGVSLRLPWSLSLQSRPPAGPLGLLTRSIFVERCPPSKSRQGFPPSWFSNIKGEPYSGPLKCVASSR
jgi:hypothetical protein